MTVALNQVVPAGKQIGKSGNTGNSTGPHFHLSLRLRGFNRLDGMLGFSDPMPYLVAPEPSDMDAARAAAARNVLISIAEARKAIAALADALDVMGDHLNP